MKTPLVLLTMLMFCSAMPTQAEEIEVDFDTPTITVTGLAEINAVPDSAVLTYQVFVEENEYEVARKEHERQMKQAMKILSENGIDSRSIKTGGRANFRHSFYFYWQRYQYMKNVRISIPVSIQIDDLTKLEKIYQELTEAKVRVPNVEFSSSKLQQYRLEAFADAIKAARRKANIMTGALDQTIGKAIQITEGTPQNMYWGFSGIANSSRSTPNGGAQAAMEQFSGGEVIVSAQVKVVFELK